MGAGDERVFWHCKLKDEPMPETAITSSCTYGSDARLRSSIIDGTIDLKNLECRP